MCDNVCFLFSLPLVIDRAKVEAYNFPVFSDPGGALHKLQDSNVVLPVEDEM